MTDRAEQPPLQIAKQGYFFVGGAYSDGPEGQVMSGHMYVEYQIPENLTQPFPLIMLSGGGQSGLNYSGTPDGREGWAEYFLRRGYAVYLPDQPGRARSAWRPGMGELSHSPTTRVQSRFTACAQYGLWPQARLHSQWPGPGVAGDPIFDQFAGQVFPSLKSFAHQQALNRDAGVALLDRLGPAVLLTHSQSGAFGWLIADSRPNLVKAIVAIEPSGPPVHDLILKGPPDWFDDGPAAKVYGLTIEPLTYEPPVTPESPLSFVRSKKPQDPALLWSWEQSEPPRKLVQLAQVPIVVIQGEASYHACYDHCTVNYLRQAGVRVDYIKLVDRGIRGNGHMMMLEANNLEIAGVIAHWLGDNLDSQGRPAAVS